MFSLTGECRFWTTSADIQIKSTDLGSFRYHDKKENESPSSPHSTEDHSPTPSPTLYSTAKRDYSARRGHPTVPDNKRPPKLKDALRKLNDHLQEHSIVHSQWRDNTTLRLMLSNGLLIHVALHPLTGAIVGLSYDKYFLGKITTDTITDVLVTRQHLILAYNQNQITFVYLQKPPLKTSSSSTTTQSPPLKIARMDPKIFHIVIGGPSATQGRRLPRSIACNGSFDLVAIWTRSSQNEVYPWRPTVRDQDRANIHLYKLSRTKLEPVCFHWTENDPLSVEFVRAQPNQLRIVEQRVTRRGEVFVEDQVYEIVVQRGVRGLQRTGVTSIPLQSQVCCQAYSPDQEKLLLGCIDGSVCLFDAQRAVTHVVRGGFIPTLVTWHCDSAVVVVGGERGQLQFFDLSLGCVRSQWASEDVVPGSVLDVGPYFGQQRQPTMLRAVFSRKAELSLNVERYAQTDTFLFLTFEKGPVACVRIVGGCGLRGDIHTSGFTVDVLVHGYLAGGQVERAINLLLCLNWDVYGAMCLIALHKIVNHVLRLPLTAEREGQLERVLGSFHAPVKRLLSETEAEFGEQVNDVMRRFFQHLVRYRAFEKAFALGIDVNEEDLFVDLYNAARLEGDEALAARALRRAEEIVRHQEENLSICSHSSCSYCGSVVASGGSGDEEEEGEGEEEDAKNIQRPDIVECSSSPPPLPLTTYREPCYMPPLPNHSSTAVAMRAPIMTAKRPSDRQPAPTADAPSHHQRMFIPKPQQLTVSHHHRSMRNRQILPPAAPPLPVTSSSSSSHLSQVANYDRSLNEVDLDDFVYDYVPRTASKRVLGSGGSGGGTNGGNGYYLGEVRRDMVIDVFPKPNGGEYIDQTLGIPVATAVVDNVAGVMRTSLPIRPAMINPLVNHHHQQTTEAPRQEVVVLHQYPLISGQIPAVGGGGGEPPAMFNVVMAPFSEGPPVVQPSAMAGGGGGSSGGGGGGGTSSNSSKSSGEKQKVKFSETITVAVLPEVPRKQKPSMERLMMKGGGPHRGGGGGGMQRLMYTDPKRELQDSLPLCHPNEDYLKDFQPAASEEDGTEQQQQVSRGEEGQRSERKKTAGTIKVIHFGVV